MSGERPGPDAAARRLLTRLLRRVGAEAGTPPDASRWPAFLDATAALLADLEQGRYLLERSLETSSMEMIELNADLTATAAHLEVEREELRRANSVLAATLESTADGILVLDSSGRMVSLNRRFLALWDIPDELLDADDPQEFVVWAAGQVCDSDGFLARMAEIASTPEASTFDILEFPDGRVLERQSQPQRIGGQIVGRVWSFRDVTEARRLQSELRYQALHDPLTHLANRALFDDQVRAACARATTAGSRIAVAVLDLDGFKHVNDSLGHLAGDALLSAVADRFRATLRDIDTVARLGGDEFAILVDGFEGPAQRLGERIIDAIAAPLHVGDRHVTISASVGIAVAGPAAQTPDVLLGNADAAMYRAKREGKNCCRVFRSWMHSAAVERLDLEQALRYAVREELVTVRYQPVLAADTGHLVGFEALARWRTATGVEVPPDTFIALAEESGLIFDLGRQVLATACRQAREWQRVAPGPAPTVAVNVSGLELDTPDFVRGLTAVADGVGLDHGLLVVEVTESHLASDRARTVAALDALRRAGIRVAIDDFGTGQSTLAALSELPVDILKIDKRFIDHIDEPRGHGLVEAVIRLARALGLETVAEGVEDRSQHDTLVALGCDMVQGYLLSRPLDAAAATALLLASAGHSTSPR